MRTTTHDDCGGTILHGRGGPDGREPYLYCDRCGAFTYHVAEGFPTGTDKGANDDAWDGADLRSPDADILR